MKFGAAGPLIDRLSEAETFSKPGTADVTASDAKRIAPLAKHYLGKPHPFTTCVRDQVKHGLTPDHAKRRCAVLLDKFDPGRLRHSRVKEEEAAEYRRHIQIAERALRELAAEHGPVPVADAALAEERPEDGWRAEAWDAAAVMEVLAPVVEALGLATGPFRNGGPKAGQVQKFKRREEYGGKGGQKGKVSGHQRRTASGKTVTVGDYVRSGASGSPVRMIQKELGVKVDGDFGPKTRRAVRQYQKQNGLLVDGVVGRQTAASILGQPEKKAGALTSVQQKKLGQRKKK